MNRLLEAAELRKSVEQSLRLC